MVDAKPTTHKARYEKYLILIPALLAAPFFAGAADGQPRGQSLPQFLEPQKAASQEKGWKFNESKITETFALMDANSDGIATGPEKKAYRAAMEKKKKTASKGPKGMTQVQFLDQQKEQSAKKGWKFKEEKSAKTLAAMDANGDEIVTSAERKAYFANRKK